MYYSSAGKGQTVVLIHGAALTSESNWSNQIPIFSKRYRVIAMDLRSHGRTNNPANSLDVNIMAEDVVKLLEKLDLGKVHVIGFSLGGVIAIRVVLKHPKLVKTLTICSSGYYVSDENLSFFAKSMDSNKMEDTNSEKAAFYRWIHKKGGTEHWIKLINQILKAPKNEIALKTLSGIDVPTLIIVGDRDQYGFTKQAMEMYDVIKNAELAIFPNTDHLVPQKKSSLFNKTVLNFLQRRGD